jgi:eukaryotic-like serine/threonine-protein kinase
LSDRVRPGRKRARVGCRDLGTTGDGSLTRRTFAAGSNIAPIWSRDGRSITFSSNRAGVYHLFSAPADGSGTARQLLAATHAQFPGSWAPDGRTLAFVESHPTNGADIWLLSSDEDKAQPFLVTRADERDPEFSPEGRWLAYTSNESGRDEVYVRPYGERSEGIQVSVDGGTCPAWNADGRDLFYQQGNRIISVALDAGRLFRAGRPRILFEGVSQGDTMTGERNWDVAPDGQRVMTVKSEEPPPPGQLYVLFNWMEELKRRALRK